MADTTPVETITMQGVKVWVKREDTNHPIVQGNKQHKLKYNLIEARKQGATTLITFGGAYSNHLLATAYAGHRAGFKTIGVVRGEELAQQPKKWSETLNECHKLGMQLVFVSRRDYRLKQASETVQRLLATGRSGYVIPEGGSNVAAVKGVAEWMMTMVSQLEGAPGHVVCPVGTGGTLAGIIAGCVRNQWDCQVTGVVVLKGLHRVKPDINQWLTDYFQGSKDLPPWSVSHDYCGSGYARLNDDMSRFGRRFKARYGFALDRIYNVKSFYALNDLIAQGLIKPGDRPLIIHTGGLQGGTL